MFGSRCWVKMATSGGKHVRLQFVGDEDVVEHIQDISNIQKYHLRKRQNVKPKENTIVMADLKDVCSDSDEEFSDMEVDPSASSTLADETGVSGGDVFQFKTPKRSGKMAELAAQSRTPSSAKKTPGKKGSIAKPQGSKKTPGKKTARISEPRKEEEESKENDIPSVRRSNRRRIPVDEESDESPDETDNSESDDSDEGQSTLKRTEQPLSVKKSTLATPSRPQATISVKVASKRKSKGNADVPAMAEEYFEAHSGAAVTSDRTLSRLNTPRMDQEQLNDVLNSAPRSHQEHCQALYEEYREQFNKWMFHLCNGFNLLFFGLGSKRLLMDSFRSEVISDFNHIVVNGFFPSITIKNILNSITDDGFHHNGSFRSPLEQCEFIKQHLEETQEEFFVIIHNIDGTMLRGEKAQNILSVLAQIPSVHMVASIDHINAPLVMDQTKASRFNWLWCDVTTYDPYIEETSYENSLLVQQSGVLALSSLTHVMRSLPTNARDIFLLLTRYQLEQKDNSAYVGMSFQDLYQRCREGFLVNSDLTLRAQLIEFRDHKLIKFRTAVDGIQYLTIPIDAATLKEFLDDHES
ncbi:origin recognition complex subunit 2-like [Ptychodera flava]|uniref:origin recognition complex subunit 2-like n=1 Tax=Ptychodera flava TaxID=63121 RepID=UPI003969DFBC